jgi:hypothetical protein
MAQSFETDVEREARTWACYNVLRMIAQLSVRRASDGMPDMYGPILGVAQAIALLAEQAPENATPRDIEKQVDELAGWIKDAALSYRKEFEETGVHPISLILTDEDMEPGATSPSPPVRGNA